MAENVRCYPGAGPGILQPEKSRGCPFETRGVGFAAAERAAVSSLAIALADVMTPLARQRTPHRGAEFRDVQRGED